MTSMKYQHERLLLTSRELNQVKAALKFWRQVAEMSRTHPSRHSGVMEMFTDHAPLSVDEIDVLLEHWPKKHPYTTAPAFARAIGCKTPAVRKWIDANKIEPAMKAGITPIYATADLAPYVEQDG